MARMETIQESPLTDKPMSVCEIIGYVLVTCKELGMDKYHGEHLAAQTAVLIMEISTKKAEDAYYNTSELSKRRV